jgi:tripartite-type tricarboxylate transporter receptor subunit TctC
MMAVALSLRDPNNAPDDLVEMLNEHIQRCGCATIGLGARQQGGFRRLAYEGGTLRAVVHRGIILFLSSLAGDRIHVNIHDVSTLDRLVEIGRAVLAPVEEEEAQARRDRVLALDAQGYTVSEIHRETGLARVKVNEILVAEGRKEKGRKYTAL